MFVITPDCTACGLCVDECPISSIEVGDPIYVINDTCCDFEECVAVCPEDAIKDAAQVTESHGT